MTEPTDKPLDDQQLDEYLKGDSSVSRQYRQLSREHVPASLDRFVLRQAEDAVKRPSRPAWMNWAKPLAVAASAVLVVSIVVETGLKDETMVTSQSVQAPAVERMTDDSSGAPPPPPPPKADVPPPVVFIEPVQSSQVLEMAPAPIMMDQPASAVARAPEMNAHIVTREPADVSMEEQLAKAEQEDKAAFAADASREKSERREQAREQDAAAQAQAAARPARNEPDQTAGPRDTVEKPAPTAVLSYSRAVGSTANSMATLQKAYTDAEAWLKDIRQLRKDNKQEEADREWRRFREAFPDYEVAETDAARAAKK